MTFVLFVDPFQSVAAFPRRLSHLEVNEARRAEPRPGHDLPFTLARFRSGGS